jgi:hypothetical protein
MTIEDPDARINAFKRAINYQEPKNVKLKPKKNKVEREPLEEIDLLDNMHSAIVDLLIEKGIITEEEYEKSVKKKSK